MIQYKYGKEMIRMIKRCDICNIEFETINPRKKYCSPECGKQGAKIRGAKRRGAEIIKDCPICGRQFEIGKDGALTKYCSQDCADEARRIRNRERWREANHEKLTTKTCIDCGQAFETYRDTDVRCGDCASEFYRYKLSFSSEERIKVCVVCGKLFTTTRSRIICCSEECGEARHKETKREWDIANYEPAPPRTVECKNCGKEFETSTTQEYCSDDCKEKYNKSVQRAKKKEEWQALPIKECEVCGKRFKSWQPSQVTCTKKCGCTHVNRKKRAYDKAWKSRVAVIDNDITVERLFERDKGICHICGSECNPDDFEVRDGAFIVGKTYPSIDHLKPRSKGGVHSWKNVKLAHHYCNTIKNNNENKEEVIERLIELIG